MTKPNGKTRGQKRQANSIAAKREGRGGLRNPNFAATRCKYADLLKLSNEEWAVRVNTAKAVKQMLQVELVKAAADAGLHNIFRDAIESKDIELVDLVERCCRIIGALYRDQTPNSAVQVNFQGNAQDPNQPLKVVFTEAKEVVEQTPADGTVQ